MIKSKVFRLKEAKEVMQGASLPKGQEIEIVMDVVYVNGNMVPPSMQPIFYEFVTKNPSFFEDDTRDW